MGSPRVGFVEKPARLPAGSAADARRALPELIYCPVCLPGVELDADGCRPATIPVVETHTLARAQAMSCCQLHDEIQVALNPQVREL